MKPSKFIAGLCAVALAAVASGEIRLAENGKTDYTIVAPEKPSRDDESAVRDLREYLTRITGAKFTVNGDAPHKIYVGRKAPSNKTPLQAFERRVRSENGDVYLYGAGLKGNAFAVYDFLEKFFDCRWYTFYGDMCIPEKKNAVFDDLTLNVIPSFDFFCYNGGQDIRQNAEADGFRRRARIYDYCPGGEMAEAVLLEGHMMSRVIPPGVSIGRANPLPPPLKYFNGKKYFETNPEFFSKMKNGRRVPGFQLCFSNMALRREFIKNLEILVENEYRGGPARMSLGLNDKGHWGDPCCHCAECKKLNEKYGHPAGSYIDFLLEVCRYFKAKYPDIRFQISAYSQMLYPPPRGMEHTPENLIISMAPLGDTNFLRSYDETPVVYDNMRNWSRVANGRFGVQLYPTVYPRPLWTYPLVANINRLVQNIRTAHELGMTELRAEFGCGPNGDMGFNELRVYLISALARDANADVDALKRDFMEHYYGKAAPMMLKYLAELEACEKAEKNALRWWPDHRSALSYLTPENLLKWQNDFAVMEKLTAADTKANLHVRRARTNLDEATMSVWYKFSPGTMPDRDVIYKRYMQNLRDSLGDVLATYEPANERPARRDRLVRWRERSMYYHYALAGKWRPLPKRFAELPAGSVKRAVPHINRKTLERNVEDSAVGIAAKGEMPKTDVKFVIQHWDGVKEAPRVDLKPGLSLEALEKGKGRRRYYYIGTTKLYPDAMISTHQLCFASGVMVGHLFDPRNPEQRYDVYLALKPTGKVLWFDEAVFVKTDRKSDISKNTEDFFDDAE